MHVAPTRSPVRCPDSGEGPTTLTLKLGPKGRQQPYDIDLAKQQQRNKRTGFERPIRRIAASSSSGSSGGAGWEWLDSGAAGWTPYDAKTSRVLERLHAGSGAKKLTKKFGRDTYVIDVAAKQQTNSRTGYKRRIRRRCARGSASTAAPSGSIGVAPPAPPGSADAAGGAGGDGAGAAAAAVSLDDVRTMTAWVEAPDDGPADVADESCPICMIGFVDDSDDEAGDASGPSDGPEDGARRGIEALPDEEARDIVRLHRCTGHWFHKGCIHAWFKEKQRCPVCSEIYGVIMGDQPAGTMKVRKESGSLPGHSGCGTIVINYHFPSGVQGEEHYHPSTPYSGTSREAYLPDNAEGRNVLRLLRLGFERRVLFTIGTSLTTGRADCVIWNGVHHKTCRTGGAGGFGYPDDSYLERVTSELAAKGVV